MGKSFPTFYLVNVSSIVGRGRVGASTTYVLLQSFSPFSLPHDCLQSGGGWSRGGAPSALTPALPAACHQMPSGNTGKNPIPSRLSIVVHLFEDQKKLLDVSPLHGCNLKKHSVRKLARTCVHSHTAHSRHHFPHLLGVPLPATCVLASGLRRWMANGGVHSRRM